jgi:hypothetical protein
MRPHERELDAEIRGHLALGVKERIEQGEDPEAARLAALRELGCVPAIRDSMRVTCSHASAPVFSAICSYQVHCRSPARPPCSSPPPSWRL